MDFSTFLLYIGVYTGLFLSSFYFLNLYFHRKELKNPEWRGEYPLVSVIIPAYNEEKTIEKTIQSVLELDYPKNKLEIIVVDDGSKDKTAEIAKNVSKRVRVFSKPNGGKASALNYGIARAKGEFIAGLDADSFVTPSALKKMLGYFNDKEVMCVTPALNVYNPKTFLQKLQHAEYLFGIFLRKIFSLSDAVHVTPGPFSIFRKEFFEKYGGYEEGNLTEDFEIALRLQSYHYKIRNSVDAVVYTVAPARFMPLLRQRRRWYVGQAQNLKKYWFLFSKKYGDLGLIILPAAVLSVFFSIIIIGYSLYKIFITTKNMAIGFSKVGFDIRPYLRPGKIELLSFFSWNIRTIFLILSLIITISYFVLAKWFSRDKRGIKIGFLLFSTVYLFFHSFWWVISFIYLIMKGKTTWGKK